LSDPTEDVRVATEAILSDFLREIRDITVVSKRREQQANLKRSIEEIDRLQENQSERAEFSTEPEESDQEASYPEDASSEVEDHDIGGMV
jgi:vacuole morphology and inheritance protein 14